LDIFEHEQQIYDDAARHVAEAKGSVSIADYEALAKQYGKLLKQLRKTTRFADRTSTGLHESNVELEDKVHYDALTGIYNRRYMDDNLSRIVKSSIRSGDELSIILIDIDCFKLYNDFYGHGNGDVCLQDVAKALTGVMMRADDFVARYGGEEFIAVLPKTGKEGADRMGERLLECIRSLRLPHKESFVVDYITVSVGATTVRPSYGEGHEAYVKRADEALYASKQNGRNQYTHIKYDEDRGKLNEG
jgi:diguanylate cyclase (GGDEF)-like protein